MKKYFIIIIFGLLSVLIPQITKASGTISFENITNANQIGLSSSTQWRIGLNLGNTTGSGIVVQNVDEIRLRAISSTGTAINVRMAISECDNWNSGSLSGCSSATYANNSTNIFPVTDQLITFRFSNYDFNTSKYYAITIYSTGTPIYLYGTNYNAYGVQDTTNWGGDLSGFPAETPNNNLIYDPYIWIGDTDNISYLENPNGVFSTQDLGKLFPEIDCSNLIFATPQGFACALKSASFGGLNVLFSPTASSTDYVINKLNGFKYVFPMSMVYQVASTVSSSLTSATNTDAVLSIPLMFTGQTVTILSSSTLVTIVGQTNKDLIFTAEKSIMWITLAIIILKMVL